MYCPNCKAVIKDESKFCTQCGYKMKTSKITSTPVKVEKVVSREENKLQEAQLNAQMVQLKMQEAQLQMQAEQLRMQQEQFNAQLRCPKCGSTSISSNKKGYGVVKGGLGAIAAVALAPVTGGGSLVAGAIGAGAGNIGAKKVICTCMNCGKKFKAGKAK